MSDTRVHERSDKWDDRRKTWSKWCSVSEDFRTCPTAAERQLVALFWRSKEKSTSTEQESDGVRSADAEFNAWDIKLVQMTDEDHKLRMRIGPCMTVTVFPNTVGKITHDVKVQRKRESYSRSSWRDHGQGHYFNQINHDVHVSQRINDDQVDHVRRSCLMEFCWSRDESLSWTLSRVKQNVIIIRVDDLYLRVWWRSEVRQLVYDIVGRFFDRYWFV